MLTLESACQATGRSAPLWVEAGEVSIWSPLLTVRDPMKLLWFSHFIPYPPRGGPHQRSYNLLRHASKLYETTFVAFNLPGYTHRQLSECEAELRNYCANVEFWEMPTAWKGSRWWARLALSPLDRLPYGCRSFWSPALDARWRATLSRHQGALVHFDSIDLAPFADAAISFRKVLNHHNCESAMAERRAQKEANPLKKIYFHSQARKLARLERAICPLFDVNLAVSELDVRILRRNTSAAHFHVVENGTDTAYFLPAMAEEEPNTVIFASSFYWYPNISAIQLFIRKIWPLVKIRHPGVRLYVAGMNPSNSLVRWLKRDPDITVVSSPPDIRPWVARAAVFVCPIQDGGGTKVKVLDAMAMGKAVVSTSTGCEGLAVKHGENILIADAPEQFAKLVSQALEDKVICQRLGAAGRALVEKNYSWEVVGGHLDQAYGCAQSWSATDHGACSVIPASSI